MYIWTEPALWAEIEYRQATVRAAVAPRWARWWRRPPEPDEPQPVAPAAPAAPFVPAQRVAGPGERRGTLAHAGRHRR